MKKIILFVALSVGALLTMSNVAYAGSCSAAKNPAAEKAVAERKKNICQNSDNRVTLDNSPYVYENPDQGCDLGLSLPGLPNLGSVGLDGIDSCRILKSITGDFVKEVNRGLQDQVDEATAGVENDYQYSVEDEVDRRVEESQRLQSDSGN